MSNLIRLPPTTNMTPQQALDSCLADTQEDHLQDVIVIGYTTAGKLYIRYSKLNLAQAHFMICQAQRWAMDGGEKP